MSQQLFVHSKCCGGHWELVVIQDDETNQADLICEKCRKSIGPEVVVMVNTEKKLTCSACEGECNEEPKKRTYPDGRISADDDGEFRIAVAGDEKNNLVQVVFEEQTKWFALGPQQAVELAVAIIKKARGISKEPLVVDI